MADLRANVLPEGSQDWIFLLLRRGVPGQDADLSRSTAGCRTPIAPRRCRSSRSLSGVLPKVAAYGFLRVALPIFPDATVQFQELILVLALASVLYGSLMAFTQTNVRLIAGYSSIAQLGFITLGIFSLSADGANGSVLQMVNHGLVVAPIFLIIALLAERYGTEDLREMGGAATASSGAGGGVPDRDDGDPRHAWVGQLHRRVLHPERPLRREDGARGDRDGRGRDGRLLRASALPEDDAQPAA